MSHSHGEVPVVLHHQLPVFLRTSRHEKMKRHPETCGKHILSDDYRKMMAEKTSSHTSIWVVTGDNYAHF